GDEAIDLLVREGRQHSLGEAAQPPILVLVGVRPAGQEHPTFAEAADEALDDSADLLAPVLRLRNLVQTVQKDQAALVVQLSFQVSSELTELRLFELRLDEVPQMVGLRRRSLRRKAAGRQVP